MKFKSPLIFRSALYCCFAVSAAAGSHSRICENTLPLIRLSEATHTYAESCCFRSGLSCLFLQPLILSLMFKEGRGISRGLSVSVHVSERWHLKLSGRNYCGKMRLIMNSEDVFLSLMLHYTTPPTTMLFTSRLINNSSNYVCGLKLGGGHTTGQDDFRDHQQQHGAERRGRMCVQYFHLFVLQGSLMCVALSRICITCFNCSRFKGTGWNVPFREITSFQKKKQEMAPVAGE